MKKNLICFYLFVFVLLIGFDTNTMKRQREELLTLTFPNSTSFIEIPKDFVKYSSMLQLYVEKYADNLSSPISFKHVSCHDVLQALADSLDIIHKADQIEHRLLEYIYNFFENHDDDIFNNFVLCGKVFGVAELVKAFKQYPTYYKEKITYLEKIYHQPIQEVVQSATTHFATIENKEKCAIIIDVDDTALDRRKPSGTFYIDGIDTRYPLFAALSPVLELYKNLITMGFKKFFFLTARTDKMSADEPDYGYLGTIHNLRKEGYRLFEKVICLPFEQRKEMNAQVQGDSSDALRQLLGLWKERERNKIAEQYTIAGTLDDTQENLKGSNIGYAVLIPTL